MPAAAAVSSSPHASDPVALLERALQTGIVAALGESFRDADPVIKPSQNPQFGDFQANGAMALAKQAGLKPRDLAQKIVDGAATELKAIADKVEIAGPGFINVRLKGEALASALHAMAEAPRNALGVEPDADTHNVVVDLCGVNVAKQMHVGHLRATIIGDALARVFERLGRNVFRQNHLGDWGLPIAMVLHHLRLNKVDLDRLEIADLDRAYREAQKHDDPASLEGAKQTLVKLQNGDADLLRDWHKLIDCTMRSVYQALEMLNVHLSEDSNRGESFYRDRLAGVVDAFVRSGLAKEDKGAIVVPFTDRERPLLIRKSDGGYLYSTTDLAAVRYRVQELGADRVVYVVDARQRDHFKDVFDAARLIGWTKLPDSTDAEVRHIGFGMVLGEDKTPLKTRSGENVTLKSLLDEAIARGTAEVLKRAEDPLAPTHGLPRSELQAIGRAVGIGAVKYADLTNDLVRDYIFSLDRMIAFEGNTGPYIQYAHARICSIFAKAGIGMGAARGELRVSEPAERTLALALLRYGGVVHDVARSLEPHRLCTYLFDLANTFSAFYQECPVLKAEDAATRDSRLRLCDLARRVLADGLNLLGIEAPQRM